MSPDLTPCHRIQQHSCNKASLLTPQRLSDEIYLPCLTVEAPIHSQLRPQPWFQPNLLECRVLRLQLMKEWSRTKYSACWTSTFRVLSVSHRTSKSNSSQLSKTSKTSRLPIKCLEVSCSWNRQWTRKTHSSKPVGHNNLPSQLSSTRISYKLLTAGIKIR